MAILNVVGAWLRHAVSCAPFVLLTLSLSSASADAQLKYSPFTVEKPRALVFDADPRFQPADNGTIEMWLAVSSVQPVAGLPKEGARRLCLLEHGSGETLDWRLSLDIADGGNVLVFGRPGAGEAQLPIQKMGEGFHHLAFVTAAGRTSILLDGAQQEAAPGHATVYFGYAPGLPKGRPLYFGCAEGPTGKAWISTLRIWDGVVLPQDAHKLMKQAGPPTVRAGLQSLLLAFSMFTDAGKDMRLAQPEIRLTNAVGAPADRPFFYRRPQGKDLRGVYFSELADNGLAQPWVEFDRPERAFALADGANIWDVSMPTVLPRHATHEKAYAAALDEANESLWRDVLPGTAQVPPPASLHARFVGERAEFMRTAFGDFDADFFTKEGRFATDVVGGATPLKIWGRTISLAAGRSFRAIGGAFWSGKGPCCVILRDQRDWSLVLGRDQGLYRLRDYAMATLPFESRLEGVYGTTNAQGRLMSIGLAYSYQPRDAMSVFDRLSAGVWVDRDQGAPVRIQGPWSRSELAAFQSVYTDQSVYKFVRSATKEMLELYDRGDLIATFMMGPDGALTSVAGKSERYPGTLQSLVLSRSGARWTVANEKTGELRRYELARPTPLAPASPDKLPWGATFSLDHRPNAVIANFMGYNPSKMRARDYQATTGASRLIFAMPDDNSRDYRTTDSRVVVPHGLLFTLDSKGSERLDATMMDKTEQRQQSWAAGLGGKIGIPMVASFQADASHQHAQEVINHRSISMIQNRAIVTHYAMVMDAGRIRLSDDFRKRIEEIRDLAVLGLLTNNQKEGALLDDFFATFGTHYAYAVSYGGMAWSETTSKTTDSKKSDSTVDKISGSANGLLDDALEIGVSANSEYSQGATDGSGSKVDRTTFGTYGGTFSKNGGWSVGRGEELPTLLDLRPIYELLTPQFFDDPLISGELREAMMNRFNKYFADIAAAQLLTGAFGPEIDDIRLLQPPPQGPVVTAVDDKPINDPVGAAIRVIGAIIFPWSVFW